MQHPDYKMTKKIIDQCFQFSQMTVLEELTNMNKYRYLSFIEFVEMLARITIVGITMIDTIDYKAHLLLEIVSEQM